jgi:hypothetical protein
MAVIAAAETPKLHETGGQSLLTVLCRAAASGDWDTFVSLLERASDVKGLKLLLAAPNGLPMRYAYEAAGLPQAGWPIFIAVVDAAVTIVRDTIPCPQAGKPLRDKVLGVLLAQPGIRAFASADQVLGALAV